MWTGLAILLQFSPEQEAFIGITPSPKSQTHIVGPPIVLSVNCTLSGAFPDVGEAVKSAVKSEVLLTVMKACFVSVSEPYWLLAVSVTV